MLKNIRYIFSDGKVLEKIELEISKRRIQIEIRVSIRNKHTIYSLAKTDCKLY